MMYCESISMVSNENWWLAVNTSEAKFKEFISVELLINFFRINKYIAAKWNEYKQWI